MKKCLSVVLLVLAANVVSAAPLKVQTMVDAKRNAFLMPHWESFYWSKDHNSQEFGNVTLTLTGSDSELDGTYDKKLIEKNLHLGLTGLTPEKAGGGILLRIEGLKPGSHTIATFHNDMRKDPAGAYTITADGKPVASNFKPSHGIESDYDVASTYFTVEAQADKPVDVRITPANGKSGVILNGVEIDCSDPHKIAAKPTPQNDDEHVDPKSALTWTAPAGAKAHLVYLGTDRDAVASATKESPEFQGEIHKTQFPLPKIDHMKTYFWRVDEVDASGKVTPGDVWRFRGRFLAFPTAEGYGRFARGGRGGRVIEVTNLDDYDKDEAPIPGSYRAAVEAEGPRTIVFRVSGLIKLKRECAIRNGFVTVAGQTAPGDGICLANYSAGMATNDAIVRFLRVRVGDKSHKAMDGLGLGSSNNSIIDHCSISWTMDEGTSSRGGNNITFQWNIISEALQHAYHYDAHDRDSYETHAFAGSISGDIGSYHHNLLAHCTDRNWSLAGGLNQAAEYDGFLDIRNNVVYNWTARTTDGGVKQLNYVANYYKPYPKQPHYVKWLLKLDPINPNWGTEQYYMVGNVMEGENYDKDNWRAFFNGPEVMKQVRVDKPLYPSYVKDESAREAYPRVLANAGATLPKRDPIDQRIVEEVRTGTVHYMGSRASSGEWHGRGGPNVPGIIDTQDDTHDAPDSPNAPWPNYKTYDVPADTDHDGMPDDWETQHGLNPNNAEDRNGDYNQDGYTNLEKYLNSLTGEYKAPPVKDAK